MTTETPKTADAAPNGAGGGSAAGTADLDALLGTYQPGKTDKPDPLKDLEPVITFAKTEMANRANEALAKDLKSAVDFVKDDEATKVISDKVVRGLLEVHAAENEAFAAAFKNKARDPGTWQAKLAEAKTAVQAELKQLSPTTRVSSDVLAARASVAGSSSTTPDSAFNPVDAFSWSDQQWKRHVDAEIAKARR
jgi:hypothetical protein